MTIESIVELLQSKALKFTAGAIRPWGGHAVRSDDRWFELRRAERGEQGQLVLIFAVNPSEGVPDAFAQVGVFEPAGLTVTADSIELASAVYVRYEDNVFFLDAGGVRQLSLGKLQPPFAPSGPALQLTKY